jgi:hypothetical protein
LFQLYSKILFFLGLTFSLGVFAAEPAETGQIVVGFEQVISKPGALEEKVVVETYYVETTAQLRQAQERISQEAKSALKSNPGLNVELVHAEYVDIGLPQIRAENKLAASEIEATRKALGVSRAFVSVASTTKAADMGFETLIETPRVVATSMTLPSIVAEDLRDSSEKTTLPKATESRKAKKINRVLTVVRTLSALGINSFMIYSTLNGDIYTPMVVPAILFYPGLELAFQKMNVHYENLLRSIPNIFGRLGLRTGVSFACLFVHVGLLSSIGLAEFSVLSIGLSSLKAAALTHSWWEMAISPKSKIISGRYVSFSLGILGMSGLLMETIGINCGSYLLYGLGASGALIWSQYGAFGELKRDAVKAKDYFVSKAKSFKNFLRPSCEAVEKSSLTKMVEQ